MVKFSRLVSIKGFLTETSEFNIVNMHNVID